MDIETPEAPPVVAVVVVHQPGAWFDEVLAAYVAQDYPNLRMLFLLTGPDPDVRVETETRIKMRLPNAFVRGLDANPGFGPAANEVLRLVDGDNGFFFIAHDDVAPDPSAVRLLVEELYRSNAGVVGPKIVDWDDPSVLRSVGFGLDRFGEVDQPIEPDEVDQEQHDGVRDVFVLSSACLLVRADLFRQLRGFDPAIDFYGDDVELCWRVHHSGARVVVAPSARVRHRGGLVERRPDFGHLSAAARHRMRAVATLTGSARLPARLFELVLVTFAELVAGVFTGRLRPALASARALVGLVPRTGSIIARRREVKPLRQVPEREVLGLQERGSAQLSSYLRHRQTDTFIGADRSIRRWRQSTTGPIIAWLLVLGALIVGSRQLIQNGVPPVGEMLRFPDSPRATWDGFVNAWNPTGPGATSANPTGLATIAFLSVFTLFRMALLQTVFVIGLVALGMLGTWKTATVFPSTRARIAALAVYAASPLVAGAFAVGSLDTLVAYAAVPWMVHAGRRAVGVGTADPRTIELDLVDGLVDLAFSERIRRTLQLALVIALAAAFTPVLLPLSLVVGVLLAVGTLLALASWRTALDQLVVTVVAAVVAAIIHLPWAGTWSWTGFVGPSPVGDPQRGLFAVAAFEIGPVDVVGLSLAFYLPLLAALLLAKAWRLTWAVRSAMLVVGFGALAVLGDRGDLPFATPFAGVLLVPVALGLALAAAAALAAFDLDVLGESFGWRQPLGLLAGLAVGIGVVPAVAALGDGAWKMPANPLSELIESQLPDVPADTDSDYRVLVLGDARLIPGAATEYRDGISYSVITQDDLTVADRWARPSTDYDQAIAAALDQIAIGSTQRGGRLLAPLGIRYIVVPEFDGVVSTLDDPLPLPLGLAEALDEQLDIVNRFAIPTVEFYENSAALPTASVLTGATAVASESAGAESLVRADLSEYVPAFVGVSATAAVTESIDAGTVHLAVPYDDNWSLRVDGTTIEPRRAFGTTLAFDVEQGGTATLAYEPPSTRGWLVALQLLLWLAVIVGAFRVSVSVGRRRDYVVADETLLSLDGPPVGLPIDPALAPELPVDPLVDVVRSDDIDDSAALPADVDDVSDGSVSDGAAIDEGVSDGDVAQATDVADADPLADAPEEGDQR